MQDRRHVAHCDARLSAFDFGERIERNARSFCHDRLGEAASQSGAFQVGAKFEEGFFDSKGWAHKSNEKID